MLGESINTIFGSNSVKNAVSGYNSTKKSIDALFESGTEKNSNLSVTTKDGNGVRHVTYYNYKLSEEPEEVNYKTSFLTPARNVKTRIENLIKQHTKLEEIRKQSAQEISPIINDKTIEYQNEIKDFYFCF